MAKDQLHADHIDTTGAYAKRFEMVRELFDSGVLTTLPEEFKLKTETPIKQEVIPVEQSVEEFQFFDKMTNQKHADHTDETGRYREEWEKKFGPMQPTTRVETPQQAEWKAFLQQLIQEERTKLNK